MFSGSKIDSGRVLWWHHLRFLWFDDANKPVTPSGAALLQKEKPVTYVFKFLTTALKNYLQIEEVAVAIRLACNKFHEGVYGKELVVETDHKSLESISKML